MGDKDINIKKDISDLFDKVSVVFDASGPRFFAYFGEQLVKFAGIKEGEKVLDVASGKGASLFPSVEKVGQSGGRFSFTTFLDKSDEKFMWFSELVEKYLPSSEGKLDEEGPEFNTEEELYKTLNDAGFKNIRVISEEKTFKYKDEQEWWDKLWTHGF